jgi:hypothetical protein
MLSFSLLVLTRPYTTIADRNQAVGTTWHVLNEVQHENNNDYEDFLIPPDRVLVASAEQRRQPVLDLCRRHPHVYGREYSHPSAPAISENETATIRLTSFQLGVLALERVERIHHDVLDILAETIPQVRILLGQLVMPRDALHFLEPAEKVGQPFLACLSISPSHHAAEPRRGTRRGRVTQQVRQGLPGF